MKTAFFQSFEDSSEREETPLRLSMVQTELKKNNLSGYLVPRSDVHQGEYVAACDERLSWLTGFTGSAGICIVGNDRAGVFVDGRYSIKAKKQRLVFMQLMVDCYIANNSRYATTLSL